MQRDLFNNINVKGQNVGSTSDNTVVSSGIVPTAGFDALTFLILTGVLADADATFAVSITHGDKADLSDGVALTDAANADDLIGTLAAASFDYSKDNKVFKVGYKGTKAYARCDVTPANNSGSAPITIVPLLGFPHYIPTSNPPA